MPDSPWGQACTGLLVLSMLWGEQGLGRGESSSTFDKGTEAIRVAHVGVTRVPALALPQVTVTVGEEGLHHSLPPPPANHH